MHPQEADREEHGDDNDPIIQRLKPDAEAFNKTAEESFPPEKQAALLRRIMTAVDAEIADHMGVN